MRFALAALLALLSWPALAPAQTDVWKNVNPNYNGPRLQQAELSIAEQRAARLVLQCCEGAFEPPDATLEHISQCLDFEEIPLASAARILLAHPEGEDCPHGGTGGGTAMWLFRLDGDKPLLLASPEEDFNGWLYSNQPSTSHGYHDLVLGWHLGAGDITLTYFRFDGKRYQSISQASDLLCMNKNRYVIDSSAPSILTPQALRKICAAP